MQDAPKDAYPEYLATLPTTQAVLKALQRACSTRHRILATQPPVSVETLWLQDEPQAKREANGASQACEWLAFSPSGRYLAVQVESKLYELCSDHSGCAEYLHQSSTHEVHIYNVAEGFRVLTRFCIGECRSSLQWTPLDHLCFARVSSLLCQEPWTSEAASRVEWQHSAAFIWDPATLTVLHSLCHEAACALRALLAGCRVFGRLVTFRPVPADSWSTRVSEEISGWMVIVDMSVGKLVVQSSLAIGYSMSFNQQRSMFWHPNSHGLITHSGIQVPDLELLVQAGFATGYLPSTLVMQAVGFSSDGEYFVAGYDRQPWGHHGNIVVVKCAMVGSSISFQIVQYLLACDSPGTGPELQVMGWLPDSSTVLLHQIGADGARTALLASLGAAPVPGRLGRILMQYSGLTAVSPAGRFTELEGSAHVRIADVQSGQQCWDSLASGPWWSNEQEGELHELLCEVGHSLCCEAWLPTGLGFICSSTGCDLADEPYIRPALHVYSFA